MNPKVINHPLRMETIAISDLKPFERNSKMHAPKQVKQIAVSIREFGFNVPILIDGGNNIIAGHGRVLACKELGITEVPAISIEHLSDAQKRAFVIADNKLTENASQNQNKKAQSFPISNFHCLVILILPFSVGHVLVSLKWETDFVL